MECLLRLDAPMARKNVEQQISKQKKERNVDQAVVASAPLVLIMKFALTLHHGNASRSAQKVLHSAQCNTADVSQKMKFMTCFVSHLER